MNDFLLNLLASGPEVVVAPLLFAGSTVFHFRLRDWPSLLQMIGATAYLILWLFGFSVMWLAMPPIGQNKEAAWASHWSISLVYIVLFFGAACFPAGFLWLALDVRRKRLATS